MKVAVFYSTRTGNTRRLAQGIADELSAYAPALIDLAQLQGPLPAADCYLVGYWADRGRADERAQLFLKQLTGQKVGLFGTLGAYPYGPHARHIMQAAEDCLSDSCLLMGHFLCQGPVDPDLLQRMAADKPIAPQAKTRHVIAATHPNQTDIQYAASLFKERLQHL